MNLHGQQGMTPEQRRQRQRDIWHKQNEANAAIGKKIREKLGATTISYNEGEMRQLEDKVYAKNGHKYWHYIPSLTAKFPHNIHELKQFLRGTKHVLDIGCGPCEALQVLQMIHPKAHYAGIEYVPEYARMARERVGDSIEVIQGDAFRFRDYKRFDAIYTYQPIRDHELLKKFYSHVWKRIEVGTRWHEVSGYLLREHLQKNFNGQFKVKDSHVVKIAA